jgi:hypothetical protein
MIKRPLLHRDGHLRRLGRGVDLVREIRVPIAEAVRRIGKPLEIAVGAPPQGLFRNRRFVLECFQLGDFVQQTGEIAVLRPGDFGTVIKVGARDCARRQRRDQSDDRKKTLTPHPCPLRETRIEPHYSRDSIDRKCFSCTPATRTDSFSREMNIIAEREKIAVRLQKIGMPYPL